MCVVCVERDCTLPLRLHISLVTWWFQTWQDLTDLLELIYVFPTVPEHFLEPNTLYTCIMITERERGGLIT